MYSMHAMPTSHTLVRPLPQILLSVPLIFSLYFCLVGTRIIYDRQFLLQMRNSSLSRTPPVKLATIPDILNEEVTVLFKDKIKTASDLASNNTTTTTTKEVQCGCKFQAISVDKTWLTRGQSSLHCMQILTQRCALCFAMNTYAVPYLMGGSCIFACLTFTAQ